MKHTLPLTILLTIGIISVCLFCSACSSLKSEFGLDTTSTNTPPISQQLNTAAAVSQEAIPAPYGQLLAGLLTLISTGAAAFATFHARRAKASADLAAAAIAPTATPAEKN